MSPPSASSHSTATPSTHRPSSSPPLAPPALASDPAHVRFDSTRVDNCPVKIDVPTSITLQKHPTGDDAYDREVMRKYRTEVLQYILAQRYWGYWLSTNVSPQTILYSQTQQHYANMHATHAMLFAAVMQSIPVQSDMLVIRQAVEAASVVDGCGTARDGVKAL